MVFLRLLTALLLLALLTANAFANVLDLSHHQKHVVERKYQSEYSDSEDGFETLYRSRRDISSELTHTRTTLQGDSHPYAAIHWSGLKESNVIFIHTYNITPGGKTSTIQASTLWRSEDYGASFSNQLSKFDNNSVISTFSYSDTDVTSIVLADLKNAVVYVTMNEGASYTRVKTAVGFSWLDYYPGSNMLLAAYDSAGLTLWGSVDGGNTWFKMKDGVVKYAFGDKSSMHIITQDQQLYTIKIDPTPQSQLTDPNLGAISTTHLHKTGDYLFVEKLVGSDNQLWVSHRNTAFRQTHFATTKYTSQQVYHIISVHDRQLLVVLTRSGTGVQGDLFLSDETGTFYTLSLEKVVTIAGYQISLSDVYVVRGMNGTLIANAVDGLKVVTMVTYDSGAEWSQIPSGSPSCSLPSCSLNFIMTISAYINSIQTGMFSKESAIGVLLAQGADSPSVPFQTANAGIGLYVSRDGGQNWTRTQNGTWLVTFADFAGAITAVPDYRSPQVTQLFYSFDEGGSWYKYSFSQDKLTIGGLLTEPGEATLVDVLFAYDQQDPNSDWQIVTVNYSNILSKPCKQSDYEDWSPFNDRVGRDCLLGSTVTWQRKKPTSLCFNGPDFNRIIKTTKCQCGIEDYECDWGYKHPEINSQACLLDSTQPFNKYAPECTDGTANYTITKGFRKIAGDVCFGGESTLYAPTVKSCGSAAMHDLSFSYVATVDSWVHLGANVTFSLITNNGISYSEYYWEFGDTHNMYISAHSFNHTYTDVGRMLVSVRSPDRKYAYSDTISVVNMIQDAVFSHSYGVQVGAKTVFNAFLFTESKSIVKSADNSPLYFGYAHFSVWYNNSGAVRVSDDLTQQFVFEHNFPFPGIFSMKVTVSGPLNKLTKNFQIYVYEEVFVMELTFSQKFNISNPKSPESWLTQVKTALTDKLHELNIIPGSLSPEVNIQPNTNIVYLSFNASNPSVDLNGLLRSMQSNIDKGLIAFSLAYLNTKVTSVRDVTDLIDLELDDKSSSFIGAIVFLVLIILTLAFLLTLSVVVILLMVKLCKKSNTQRSGPTNRVYMHVRDDDSEMEPLTVESDDDHLLPPDPVSEPGIGDRPDDPPVET